MKTLKEKLEDIIQLNGEPTEYMEQMLYWLDKAEKYSNVNNLFGFIKIYEDSLHYSFYYSGTYHLSECVYELIQNKGKDIVKELHWLN